ncbi:unnamed protein product [Durusdinium trenchii]|uniref:Uncharacterized protein n=1 Tax=Durusdinium trenchii TaxID=1381693 RepID=A0ABP0PQ72_9DINO
MEALMQKLSVNALVIFQAPCFKRSPYHSGGRFLDLTRKQKVVVDALPPTDAAYVPLKHSVQKGPCTPGEIADLQGLQNGNKADLTCKICDLNHRIIKENQEKTELWVKDASDKRLLVEAWGRSFAETLQDIGVDEVVCLMNFSSDRGSAFAVKPGADDVLRRFEEVTREGGEKISAWFHHFDKDQSYRRVAFTKELHWVLRASLVGIDYREFDKGLKAMPGARDSLHPPLEELKFGGQKEDCVKLWQTGRSLSPPPAALSTPEELDEDNSGEISFEEFAEPQEAGLDGKAPSMEMVDGEHGEVSAAATHARLRKESNGQ